MFVEISFFFFCLSSCSSSSGKILFDKCCSILIKLRDAAEFTSVGVAVFCRWGGTEDGGGSEEES